MRRKYQDEFPDGVIILTSTNSTEKNKTGTVIGIFMFDF